MEEERRKKILMMRLGIALIMIFILAFWVFNLKNTWRSNEPAPAKNDQDWAQLKNDFNKTINDLENRLHQDADKKAADLASSTLDNLIKNTAKIASSSTSSIVVSTSTLATITPPVVKKENKNCPAYVNCMPTVGGPARPCSIPPGCEGITTIAY